MGVCYFVGSIFTLTKGVGLTEKNDSITRYSSFEDPIAIRSVLDLVSSGSDSSCWKVKRVSGVAYHPRKTMIRHHHYRRVWDQRFVECVGSDLQIFAFEDNFLRSALSCCKQNNNHFSFFLRRFSSWRISIYVFCWNELFWKS